MRGSRPSSAAISSAQTSTPPSGHRPLTTTVPGGASKSRIIASACALVWSVNFAASCPTIPILAISTKPRKQELGNLVRCFGRAVDLRRAAWQLARREAANGAAHIRRPELACDACLHGFGAVVVLAQNGAGHAQRRRLLDQAPGVRHHARRARE